MCTSPWSSSLRISDLAGTDGRVSLRYRKSPILRLSLSETLSGFTLVNRCLGLLEASPLPTLFLRPGKVGSVFDTFKERCSNAATLPDPRQRGSLLSGPRSPYGRRKTFS
ncbi:hypothetical protein GWI33_013422 [Rhynchophorus ferrugineus]|uniref:Uncharacterized protein n=1 Tax=Rhynchophorus ferrugineus TaxID=354439 RepID=A0A834I730_RHYFE|nr:hypothetical protein GWI33_013422 [Rhynchophorus ferrugineus]